MDQSPSSLTAAYVVNNMAEEEISRIIQEVKHHHPLPCICKVQHKSKLAIKKLF